MAISDLPSVVVEEILVKLPTKTLIKCRCVCKSWYKIIHSFHFISTHIRSSHHRTSHHPDEQLMILVGKKDKFCFLDGEEECLRVANAKSWPFQCKPLLLYPTVVGSMNGVVCMYEQHIPESGLSGAMRSAARNSKHSFVLWNPCIERWFQIPRCDILYLSRPHQLPRQLIGFGFDGATCDFKIIAMDYGGWQQAELIEARTYSLNAGGSWKTLTTNPPSYHGLSNETPASVGKWIHWLVSNGSQNLMMVYDVGIEKFSELSLPASDEFELDKLLLHNYKASLAIVGTKDGYYSIKSHIWVMKEYGDVGSWTKVSVLDETAMPISHYRILHLESLEEIYVGDDKVVLCLQSHSGKFKTKYTKSTDEIGSVHAYTCSLALMDKGSDSIST